VVLKLDITFFLKQQVMKFKIGDKVRIVNYGGMLMIRKNEYHDFKITFPILKEKGDFYLTDMRTDLVGKETIITKAENGQYGTALLSWLYEEQLELI
jgi:hypothetical protein